MATYTYLLVNLACISIPLIASFYPKHRFFNEWPSFFKASSIVAVFFISWDYLFTYLGIWSFNEVYLTGIYIGALPIEEILFFFCIPYACVFTFFALKYIIKQNPFNRIESLLTTIFIVVLLLIAILNFDRAYTSTTFIITALYLYYLKHKNTNLSYHYLCYFSILPMFYVSNGVLTGSFLVDPIVNYNDFENLGIRIGNIPIEDFIYGLLLIFSNIELYSYFKNSKKLP